MRGDAVLAGLTLAVLVGLPVTAAAQAVSFKLLPRYSYLDTEVEANRWVTFDVKSVEVTGPLEPGKQLLILKLSNDIAIETDLVFIKP